MSDLISTVKTLLSNIPKKKGDVGFIVGIMIIGYIIYLVINLNNSRKEILNNWGANRCNLSILPIAGFIKPIGKKKFVGIQGTYKNFVFCVDTMSSSWAKILIEPFIILIHIAVETFEGVLDQLLNVSNKFKGLHSNIFSQLFKYLKELKNIKEILLYINEKLDSIKAKFVLIIRDILNIISNMVTTSMKLVTDYFKLLLKIILDIKSQLILLIVTNTASAALRAILWGISLSTATSFFASFVLAPLGVVHLVWGIIQIILWIVTLCFIVILSILLVQYNKGLKTLNLDKKTIKYMRDNIDKDLCFTNTKIKMNNGDSILLSDICVGEYLEDNNIILGKIVINVYDNIEIYKYNGIEVTGNHLVLNNGKWERVGKIWNKDMYNKEQLSKDIKYVDKLYCLITKNNTIKINNIVFGDYNETNDKLLQSYINYYVMNSINSINSININGRESYKPNLNQIINHIYLPCLSKITYDKIINNYKDKDINEDVYGFVKILYTPDIKLYRYYDNILSGNMIVLYEGVWKRVWECSISVDINDYNDKYLYHVMFNNNIINIDNNVTIRDFTETNNVDVNLKIDTMVENNLNN